MTLTKLFNNDIAWEGGSIIWHFENIEKYGMLSVIAVINFPESGLWETNANHPPTPSYLPPLWYKISITKPLSDTLTMILHYWSIDSISLWFYILSLYIGASLKHKIESSLIKYLNFKRRYFAATSLYVATVVYKQIIVNPTFSMVQMKTKA